MAGLGTIINVASILIGTTVGILIKGGLSKRFEDTVTSAIGLCTIFIGISGAVSGMLKVAGTGLETQDTMVMIISLIVGALIGEWTDVERRLETVGEWCKSKIPSHDGGGSTFVEAFVSSSLIFCVGAMSFVGSILIFALGINLLFGKKMKIGNLLPAMFIPLALQFFL